MCKFGSLYCRALRSIMGSRHIRNKIVYVLFGHFPLSLQVAKPRQHFSEALAVSSWLPWWLAGLGSKIKQSYRTAVRCHGCFISANCTLLCKSCTQLCLMRFTWHCRRLIVFVIAWCWICSSVVFYSFEFGDSFLVIPLVIRSLCLTVWISQIRCPACFVGPQSQDSAGERSVSIGFSSVGDVAIAPDGVVYHSSSGAL